MMWVIVFRNEDELPVFYSSIEVHDKKTLPQLQFDEHLPKVFREADVNKDSFLDKEETFNEVFLLIAGMQ